VITFVIATVLMFGTVLAAILWATAKDRRLNPRPRPARRFALTYGKERHARDH
jgi:hypothetical protein